MNRGCATRAVQEESLDNAMIEAVLLLSTSLEMIVVVLTILLLKQSRRDAKRDELGKPVPFSWGPAFSIAHTV